MELVRLMFIEIICVDVKIFSCFPWVWKNHIYYVFKVTVHVFWGPSPFLDNCPHSETGMNSSWGVYCLHYSSSPLPPLPCPWISSKNFGHLNVFDAKFNIKHLEIIFTILIYVRGNIHCKNILKRHLWHI